ncbi:MAG: zf-HC2 domain-containing protein [Gemmatimonadetes bacterium]|nr:zf-HC2 domain-containing protein [Gemmatimonadota bacterium]
MTDSWTDRLSEYVDGELDPATRAALEAHLVTCASCRATHDELQRVVDRARGIGYREPATDLWGAIETSITAHTPRAGRRLVTVSWARLAAAAAIVALLAGGFAWTLATRRTLLVVTPASSRDTLVTVLPQPSPTGAATTVAAYRDAAADLQRAFEAGRSTLRPETMRVIEENLRAIDLAIAQTDSALRRDPGSAYLNEYLVTTMQRKLKLLRRAVEITTARS